MGASGKKLAMTAIRFLAFLAAAALSASCGENPTAPRPSTAPSSIKDRGDGAVEDEISGLMWTKRVSPTAMTWIEAKRYCETRDTGGFTDWRLPEKDELHALYEALGARQGEDHRIEPFQWNGAEGLWSATRYRSYTSIVHIVFFQKDMIFYAPKTQKYHVLPVRSPKDPGPGGEQDGE